MMRLTIDHVICSYDLYGYCNLYDYYAIRISMIESTGGIQFRSSDWIGDLLQKYVNIDMYGQ